MPGTTSHGLSLAVAVAVSVSVTFADALSEPLGDGNQRDNGDALAVRFPPADA